MSHRDRYMSTLRGKETTCLPFAPITMMYAADLVGHPYSEYATDHRVLLDGQRAVAERFDASVVSVISDPCVEASDLGADVVFPDDAPPAVREEHALVADKAILARLAPIDPSEGRRMSNRLAGVRALSEAVGSDLMVEGWVEGPCAEAADLRGINRLMLDFYDDPGFVADLMDFVVEQETRFAVAQVESGATMVGIGDAASSLIGKDLYDRFVAPRTRRLIDAIHDSGAVVRLHICGGIMAILPTLGALGADQIDVDSMNEMAIVRKEVGSTVPLCGNLDPVRVVRDGSPKDVRVALEACLRDVGNPYIVGAGCEIPRGTPFENLDEMAAFAAGG